MCNGVRGCWCEGLWDICSDSIHVNPSLHGAGYHDGFIIPANATSIQIMEELFNPNVYLGERVWSGGPLYIQLHAYLHKTLVGQSFSSSFWLPGAAVTTGAVPPLNGGYNVVSNATFHAGGAVWTYTGGTVETLECAGPLSTSVRVQVSDTLLRSHDTVM